MVKGKWTLGWAAGLLAGLALVPASRAATIPAVVELFTSEGCSSCPPAEALLGELGARPDVLTLAFHVDYWDRLGWKDPYASPEATDRQKGYAQALDLRTIYTPQMVIDGRTELVGSDRGAVLAALKGERSGTPLVLTAADGTLSIGIGENAAKAGPAAGDKADILLFAVSRQAESRILRGENAGRLVREASIVRQIRPLGSWDGGARTVEVALASLPADSDQAVVLLQSPGQGRILGAAGIRLK